MKKFLRGYPEITIDQENNDDSLEAKTKNETSTLYSEFQCGILNEEDPNELCN